MESNEMAPSDGAEATDNTGWEHMDYPSDDPELITWDNLGRKVEESKPISDESRE